MNYYRKKLLVIEAIQFKSDGSANVVAIQEFMGKHISPEYESGDTFILIRTLEGIMRADINDWIIKGVKGEFYPCKPDIFQQSYEPASHTPEQEGEAISFAEWIVSDDNPYQKRYDSDDDNDGKWYDYFSQGINRHYFTTAELYKVFKNK